MEQVICLQGQKNIMIHTISINGGNTILEARQASELFLFQERIIHQLWSSTDSSLDSC